MKRVKCPECGKFIRFDETKYEAGRKLIFQCPNCGKTFGIRMGGGKKSGAGSDAPSQPVLGHIVVIENVFCYKQVIPLHEGDNVIGRYMKGSDINCPIETSDPSIDMTHCVINVSKDKKGNWKYVLRDGPSFTGTFVDNEILGDKERRVITDGTLFTIGATSIILELGEN